MQENITLWPLLGRFVLVYVPAVIVIPDILSRLGLSVSGPGDLAALMLASLAAAYRFVAVSQRLPDRSERLRFALAATLVAAGMSLLLGYAQLRAMGGGDAAGALRIVVTHIGAGVLTTVVLLILAGQFGLSWLFFGQFARRRHATLVRKGLIAGT
jgi:hypothetical protein